MECWRSDSCREHWQSFSAVLAALGVFQPEWIGFGTAYLFANSACPRGSNIGYVDRGARHPVYGAITSEFLAENGANFPAATARDCYASNSCLLYTSDAADE